MMLKKELNLFNLEISKIINKKKINEKNISLKRNFGTKMKKNYR